MIYTPFTRLRFTIETSLTPEEAMAVLGRETKECYGDIFWVPEFLLWGTTFWGQVNEKEFRIAPGSYLGQLIIIDGIFQRNNDGTVICNTISCHTTFRVGAIVLPVVVISTCILGQVVFPLIALPFMYLIWWGAIYFIMHRVLAIFRRLYAAHLVGPDAFQVSAMK